MAAPAEVSQGEEGELRGRGRARWRPGTVEQTSDLVGVGDRGDDAKRTAALATDGDVDGEHLAKSLAQPMRALLGAGTWVPDCDAEACQGRRSVASNNGTCVGTTQGEQLGATRMRARRA